MSILAKSVLPPRSARASPTDALSERTLKALRVSESRYRRLFETAQDGILLLNADTAQIEDVNPYLIEMLGYSHGEFLGKKLWEVGPFADVAQSKEMFAQLQADGYVRYEDLPLKTKAGAPVQVEFVSNSYDCEGIKVIQCNIRNITERKRVEAALREQEEFFRLIAENIGDFIAVLDLNGRRLYNSPSYRRLFGSVRDLLGTDSFGEIHPEDQQRVRQVFRETVQSGIGHQTEYRFVLEDGDIRHMESRGGVMRDEQGRVARVLVVSRDITERKQMEDQVRQLAFYDALTKLPNRRLLNERLSQTMAASKRSGRYGALMFLDLDNFKPLNDTHGHEVGDLLLIEAADRLKSCVREVDTVARFGGDEFVVMISELDVDKSTSTTQAGIIAGKIRAALAKPYELKVQHEGKAETTVEHHCTASIGVALFVKDETSRDNILKRADMAMYQAKEAGCNLARFHDSKAWAPA